MDERDVDAEFAAIVSRWDRPEPDAVADDEAPPDRDEEAPPDRDEETPPDRDDTEPPPGTETARTPPPGTEGTGAEQPLADVAGTEQPSTDEPPQPRVSTWLPVATWRAPSTGPPDAPTPPAGSDEDEHFVPPPVQLPPQEDVHYWGAVLALVAGPLMLLYVVFAEPFHRTWWLLAALAVFAGGFALLVLRLPRERDEDDPDDGARV